MKVKNLILFIFLLVCASPKAFSYDAVGRLQLIEDRYKIQESLRPFEHRFGVDTSVYLSGDFQAVADDISALADSTQNQTDTFNTLAEKWDGNEFGGRFLFQFGIPFFSFNFGL